MGRDCSYTVAETINRRKSKSRQRILAPDEMVHPEHVREVSWVVVCSVIWGGIMYYYRKDGDRKDTGKDYLLRALRVSMDFIYGATPHALKEMFDYGSR